VTAATTAAEVNAHMQVLHAIDSPRGFVILPIHYSHDPEKNNEEWRLKERAKYDRDEDWNKEQEIDFASISGAAAYSNFRPQLHLDPDLELMPEVPLCLCVDFNVDPMIWEVAQIFRDQVLFIDEIAMRPGSTQAASEEVRRRYPAHPGELWIFGDATGSARTTPTAQSDYDVMRLVFRNYPSLTLFRIPPSNPPVRDRIHAFNQKLRSAVGAVVGVKINPKKCPELVLDMTQVVMDPDGGGILKSRDPRHPYFQRTHASDAAGYLISQEYPVFLEVAKGELGKARPRQKYGQLRGAV